MIRLCTLASGSKGNCILVSAGGVGVLIDAGLSAKETLARLEQCGADPARVKHLILTHEHTDHVRGLGPVARKLDLTVHASPKTFDAARWTGELPRTEPLTAGRTLKIGPFTVQPFTMPHDAADPVGLIFNLDGLRLGVATDLGYPHLLVRQKLQKCHTLVIESNHDPLLLKNGPYPEFLKQRINSRVGHLSNDQACDLIGDVAHTGLKSVVLAHLSQKNNTPTRALEAARATLDGLGLTNTTLVDAEQDRPGPVITIG